MISQNIRRRCLSSNNFGVLSLSRTSSTVGPDSASSRYGYGSYLEITVYWNGEVLKNNEVLVTYSGSVFSDYAYDPYYDASVGKVFIGYCSNDKGSARDGYVYILYKNQQVTFTLHQRADSIVQVEQRCYYSECNSISISSSYSTTSEQLSYSSTYQNPSHYKRNVSVEVTWSMRDYNIWESGFQEETENTVTNHETRTLNVPLYIVECNSRVGGGYEKVFVVLGGSTYGSKTYSEQGITLAVTTEVNYPYYGIYLTPNDLVGTVQEIKLFVRAVYDHPVSPDVYSTSYNNTVDHYLLLTAEVIEDHKVRFTVTNGS